MIVPPAPEALMETVEIKRGPNIKPFPYQKPYRTALKRKRFSRLATTSPQTTSCLPAPRFFRTVPTFPICPISVSASVTKSFPSAVSGRAAASLSAVKTMGRGSSREHAALVPLYLGIKAVIAKSYARIHCANLANAGLIPLEFKVEDDYDRIDQMDELSLPHIREELQAGTDVTLCNLTKGTEISLTAVLTDRQRKMVLAGGLLNYTKDTAE